MFTYIEDILSIELIDKLYDKYYQISDTDESSHDIWHEKMTENKTLVPTYTVQLSGKDKMLIQYELFNRIGSPFYNMKDVKHCDAAIIKYPTGSKLPFHIDTAIASCTIFLNKSWTLENGGIFQWVDRNNITHDVVPKYNCGVYSYYGEQQEGAEHGATEVLGENHRAVLQIFLRKPGEIGIKYRAETLSH